MWRLGRSWRPVHYHTWHSQFDNLLTKIFEICQETHFNIWIWLGVCARFIAFLQNVGHFLHWAFNLLKKSRSSWEICLMICLPMDPSGLVYSRILVNLSPLWYIGGYYQTTTEFKVWRIRRWQQAWWTTKRSRRRRALLRHRITMGYH